MRINFSTIRFFGYAMPSALFHFPQKYDCGKLVEKFSKNSKLCINSKNTDEHNLFPHPKTLDFT